MTARETTEEYKYTSFAIETAFKIITAEQNTSKQISIKETAVQNLYKYSLSFFF